MNSREEILNRVKNNGIKIENLPTTKTEDPVKFINNDGDLYNEFKNRIIENKAFFIENDDLESAINEIIQKEQVKNLIYPQGLKIDIDKIKIDSKFKFDKSIDEFKDKIFDYDVSIINAKLGVSSHGVFAIASNKIQPRLLSLTPKVCIVLIDKKTIVKSLSEALNKIKAEEGRFPTNIVFISGPSRTSDIELQLVLGVHGSQIVYILPY